MEALPNEVQWGLNGFDKFDTLASLTLILDVLQPGHTNGNLRRADRFDLCRTSIVDTVLWSLTRCNISSLRSLTLINFPCRPHHALLATLHLTSLLKRLQDFSIHVSLWSEQEEPIDVWDSMKVFLKDFSRTWIEPLSSVTSLNLSMNGYLWGYNPRVDFRSATLPHIKKLEMTYFTFSHDWQLQWLSNLQTLESLVLDSCAIITHAYSRQHLDDDGYPMDGTCTSYEEAIRLMYQFPPVYFYGRKWSDYFRTFATTLVHLKSCRILDDRMDPCEESYDISCAASAHEVQTQYLSFIHGNWLTTGGLIEAQVITDGFDAKEQLKRDRDALKELLGAIEKRSPV